MGAGADAGAGARADGVTQTTTLGNGRTRVHGAGELPPAALLLRRPATTVRHVLLDALARAGFDDVLPAHLGVFQHPGPDGLRPGTLAARTHASKQAMNHLLHQLESSGYLVREQQQQDRRTRVVRLTDRGWAALDVIHRTGHELERAWVAALGADTHRALQLALLRLESVLDAADLPASGQRRSRP